MNEKNRAEADFPLSRLFQKIFPCDQSHILAKGHMLAHRMKSEGSGMGGLNYPIVIKFTKSVEYLVAAATTVNLNESRSVMKTIKAKAVGMFYSQRIGDGGLCLGKPIPVFSW